MGDPDTSPSEISGAQPMPDETEQFDDCTLRPIVLPGREVLVTAAERAPTFASVTRLARLLEPHGTRDSRVLRLDQAKALTKLLPTADLDRARAAGVTVRSTRQLPEVRRRHRLALVGGLFPDVGSRQPAAEGEDVLDGWWRFFSTPFESGIRDAVMQDRDVLAKIVGDPDEDEEAVVADALHRFVPRAHGSSPGSVWSSRPDWTTRMPTRSRRSGCGR